MHSYTNTLLPFNLHILTGFHASFVTHESFAVRNPTCLQCACVAIEISKEGSNRTEAVFSIYRSTHSFCEHEPHLCCRNILCMKAQ